MLHRASACARAPGEAAGGGHQVPTERAGLPPTGQHPRGLGYVAQQGGKMSVAIGYMPGAFGPGEQDPHFLRQLVQVGDTYGYDSLWLSLIHI